MYDKQLEKFLSMDNGCNQTYMQKFKVNMFCIYNYRVHVYNNSAKIKFGAKKWRIRIYQASLDICTCWKTEEKLDEWISFEGEYN